MIRCTPTHTAVITLMLAVGVGLLAGCSGKPENSPVIRRKFKEFDVVKEESKAAEQQLAQMSVEISILKDQVENLRALVPDAQGQVSAVSRIEKLEARLSGVENGQLSTISNTSSRSAAPARNTQTAEQTSTHNPLIESPRTVDVPAVRRERGLARPDQATEPESAPAPRATTPSESAKPSQTVAQASLRTNTAPAPKPVKKAASRGSYYELKPGDTLESIAKANNLSVDAIKKENRLPSGARLLAGQKLYLPPQN